MYMGKRTSKVSSSFHIQIPQGYLSNLDHMTIITALKNENL